MPMYAIFGAWSVLSILANIIGGFLMGRQKSRTLLMVIGGINCVNIPFGTALGICTFLVLTRDSVRELFQSHLTSAQAGAPL